MKFPKNSFLLAVTWLPCFVQSFTNTATTSTCLGTQTMQAQQQRRAFFPISMTTSTPVKDEEDEDSEGGKNKQKFIDVFQKDTPDENSLASQVELMPRNLGRIVKTPLYEASNAEAWKDQFSNLKESPKLITIDALNVLIQTRAEIGWFFRDVLHEATDYNARLIAPEHFTAAFEKAYKEIDAKMPCFGVRDGITSRNWWKIVTQKTYAYVDLTEPGLREELDEWLLEDVFDVLFHDVFMTEEAWEIKPGALEALSYMKKWREEEQGPMALAILSNFDERMHAILDQLDLLSAFDFVLTSREVGSPMPERSTFQVAMSRLGVTDPAECMHISADFDCGVIGASNAGWHAVFLPPSGELIVPPNTPSNLVFSMLGDLFGILHIWDKEPENRLIDTTKPVLENGVDAFHEKMWDDSDIAPTDVLGLPPDDRTKSWEGPGRF